MYVGVPEDEFLLTPPSLSFGERLSVAQCQVLAYRLAFAGLGHVSPNPLVGCVITDARDRLLAVGAHRRYGEQHAEVEAVTQALARGGAKCLRGATMHVTLQPCTHHGKTPPCSELLLQHRLRRVYFGLSDPNPRVGDLQKLQQAGIVCEKYEHHDLQWLDEAYFFHMQRHAAGKEPRPFVAVKIAAGLDGSFAAHASGKGTSKRLRLSCARALQYGHFLRQRYDAIMVGAGTLQLDDPRLNVRVAFPQRRTPKRVVLANAMSLRADLRVLTSEPHTAIVVVPETEAKHCAALLPAAAVLLPLPRQAEGGFNLLPLLQTLQRQHDIHSLLVEGGGKLWASFFSAGLVDKLHLLQSPCIHPQARRWMTALDNAPAQTLRQVRMLPLADDWAIEGRYTAKLSPS